MKENTLFVLIMIVIFIGVSSVVFFFDEKKGKADSALKEININPIENEIHAEMKNENYEGKMEFPQGSVIFSTSGKELVNENSNYKENSSEEKLDGENPLLKEDVRGFYSNYELNESEKLNLAQNTWDEIYIDKKNDIELFEKLELSMTDETFYKIASDIYNIEDNISLTETIVVLAQYANKSSDESLKFYLNSLLNEINLISISDEKLISTIKEQYEKTKMNYHISKDRTDIKD